MRLPCQPEMGWVTAELMCHGEPMAQGPRRLLRCLLERASGLDG